MRRGTIKIGTTRRGIGPAYEDKVGRRAIRVGDLGEPECWRSRSRRCSRITIRSPGPRKAAGRCRQAHCELLALAPKILPFAEDVWERLDALRAAGKRILFEGAQATMLDIDHGTYPFVTSSNTVAAQADDRLGLGNGAVATCWASPRPTPRASATAPSRPSSRTRSASSWAIAATSSAPIPDGAGAAAGSTR